jgi:serine/threonine protein kinase
MTESILNQRYQLDEELGSGSMGIVYHAHDLLLDRDVLVKVLNQASLEAGRKLTIEQVQGEARRMAAAISFDPNRLVKP